MRPDLFFRTFINWLVYHLESYVSIIKIFLSYRIGVLFDRFTCLMFRSIPARIKAEFFSRIFELAEPLQRDHSKSSILKPPFNNYKHVSDLWPFPQVALTPRKISRKSPKTLVFCRFPLGYPTTPTTNLRTTPTTRKTAESPPPSLGAPSKAGQFLWSHHGNSWSNSKNHSREIPNAVRVAY